MQSLGIASRQPAFFYRELIKEAREVIPLLTELQRRLTTSEKAKAQAESRISSLEGEAKSLRGKMTSLEAENHQLRSLASNAQENAAKYESIKGAIGRKSRHYGDKSSFCASNISFG